MARTDHAAGLMQKIIGIVQARVASSRLPGKVLLPLNGLPAIVRIMQRAAAQLNPAQLFLATSVHPENDALAALAARHGWNLYRGSEDDVLSRFVDIVKAHRPDIVVRINADNFAIDPEVIAHAVEEVAEKRLDVCSPFIHHTYPFGAGAEVSTAECLLQLDRETGEADKAFREHIYFYAYEHPDRYRIGYLTAPESVRRPDIRISVDTPADYEQMKRLYERFAGQEHSFRLPDVIAVWDSLQQPRLC